MLASCVRAPIQKLWSDSFRIVFPCLDSFFSALRSWGYIRTSDKPGVGGRLDTSPLGGGERRGEGEIVELGCPKGLRESVGIWGLERRNGGKQKNRTGASSSTKDYRQRRPWLLCGGKGDDIGIWFG